MRASAKSARYCLTWLSFPRTYHSSQFILLNVNNPSLLLRQKCWLSSWRPARWIHRFAVMATDKMNLLHCLIWNSRQSDTGSTLWLINSSKMELIVCHYYSVFACHKGLHEMESKRSQRFLMHQMHRNSFQNVPGDINVLMYRCTCHKCTLYRLMPSVRVQQSLRWILVLTCFTLQRWKYTLAKCDIINVLFQ